MFVAPGTVTVMATVTPRLMTNQDLADLMGWSVQTVHMRRYRGQSLPPAIVVGKTIRYRPQDVEAWLISHTTTADNDHDNVR